MHDISLEPFALLVLLILLLNAALVDLREHRVPNVLAFIILTLGVVMAGLGISGQSLPGAAAGVAAGLLLFMPLYLVGGFGAGDVKLLACAGSFIGPMPILYAGAGALMCGAVFAGLYLLALRLRKKPKASLGSLDLAEVDQPSAAKTPLPFAPFIFLSTAFVAITGMGV